MTLSFQFSKNIIESIYQNKNIIKKQQNKNDRAETSVAHTLYFSLPLAPSLALNPAKRLSTPTVINAKIKNTKDMVRPMVDIASALATAPPTGRECIDIIINNANKADSIASEADTKLYILHFCQSFS